MDWTEKYRPRSLSDVRGNNKSVEELQEWADTWEDHREPALVIGEPGVGKTSAVNALASDKGWSVTELNASDSRTADVLNSVAGEASKSQSITGKRQLIILDEADNLHGNADRGGARAVTEIVKESSQPIVLIANDEYEISNTLRNKCREIEFRNVSSRSIKPVLRDLLNNEGIEFDPGAIDVIANRNSGDLRGAINDLQAVATGRERVTVDDVQTSGDRDRTTDIFEFMDTIFKGTDVSEALQQNRDLDESPEDLIHWIDENLPSAYSPEELRDGFRYLSRGDIYLGRTRDTQNYSLWRYAADMMIGGVQIAKKEKKSGWISYSPPGRWRRLGRSRGKRSKRDGIARKIGQSNIVSMSTAREEYLDVLRLVMTDRDIARDMALYLELEPDELSYLLDIDQGEAEEILEKEPEVMEVEVEEEEEQSSQSDLSSF